MPRPKDARRRAREAALQILYQWEIGQTDVDRAVDTFFTHQWREGPEGREGPEAAPPEAVRQFASALAHDTVARLEAIDRLIAETAERWRPERMAVLDRLILRVAIFEL